MRARAALLAIAAVACGESGPGERPAKIYVAAQEVGVVDVLDGATLEPRALIAAGPGRAPHNVTVSPDGTRVFVTNASADGSAPDELLAIDPATDAIVERVPLDPDALVAHVVVSPDGGRAYVSGWQSDRVYRIDLGAMTRLDDVYLPPGRRPHGMRLSADGARLYTANSAGSVDELDAATGALAHEYALPGPAVQIAVGAAAIYATVSRPPAVARIDPASGDVAIWPVDDGRALAQLALTPDGARLVVCDQGDRSFPGSSLYVLDAATGAVLARHGVDMGAHGVEIARDGHRAYVTGAYDGTVTAVSLDDGSVDVGPVDRGPNGIALWWGEARALRETGDRRPATGNRP